LLLREENAVLGLPYQTWRMKTTIAIMSQTDTHGGGW
jgi:hypothetical protein